MQLAKSCVVGYIKKIVNFVIFENHSFDFCSPGDDWLAGWLGLDGWIKYVYGRVGRWIKVFAECCCCDWLRWGWGSSRLSIKDEVVGTTTTTTSTGVCVWNDLNKLRSTPQAVDGEVSMFRNFPIKRANTSAHVLKCRKWQSQLHQIIPLAAAVQWHNALVGNSWALGSDRLGPKAGRPACISYGSPDQPIDIWSHGFQRFILCSLVVYSEMPGEHLTALHCNLCPTTTQPQLFWECWSLFKKSSKSPWNFRWEFLWFSCPIMESCVSMWRCEAISVWIGLRACTRWPIWY